MELRRIRKDLHNLFVRMRDLSPPNTTRSQELDRVASVARHFAAEVVGVKENQITRRGRGTEDGSWAKHVAIAVTHRLTGAHYKQLMAPFGIGHYQGVKYALEHVEETVEEKYRAQFRSVLEKTQFVVGRLTPSGRATKEKLTNNNPQVLQLEKEAA